MVEGREVRPRRAREAFCRCEQAWARRTRDMMAVGGREGGRRPVAYGRGVGAGLYWNSEILRLG